MDEQIDTSPENRCINIMLVGDINVGKTSFLMTRVNGRRPTTEFPALLPDFKETIIFRGSTHERQLIDTYLYGYYSGSHDIKQKCTFKQMAELQGGREIDVFLCCFSCIDLCSLEHLRDVYHPEIKRYFPDAKIVLCGLKSDLRTSLNTVQSDKVLIAVSHNDIDEIAQVLEAFAVCECSVLEGKKEADKVLGICMCAGLGLPIMKPKRSCVLI